MPFHLAAHLASVDNAGAFADLAALADQRLFTNGNNIRVPALNNIIALAGGAENATVPRMRVYSPTIERVARVEVTPLNVSAAAAVTPGSPHRIMDLRDDPLVLGVDENYRVELLSNPVAAQFQWMLTWFADGPVQRVNAGNVFPIRATSATTLVAGAWTICNLTLDDELPPGIYAVVGARFQSATVVAGRLNFLGGDNPWRPGAMGSVAINDLASPMFRAGELGEWGRFPFTQLPQAEFLATSADTAELVYLDVVQVG